MDVDYAEIGLTTVTLTFSKITTQKAFNGKKLVCFFSYFLSFSLLVFFLFFFCQVRQAPINNKFQNTTTNSLYIDIMYSI